MNSTSASVLHLSRRATALAVLVLAVVGSAAFTTGARADFTLNSGRITLVAGGTTGNPPSGSWVSLPTDDPFAAPPYFTNPSSTWTGTPDGLFTRIQPGTIGLTLGATQPSGGIIGGATDTFAGLPFMLISTSHPTLTFSGTSTAAGTRLLTGGDLSGLRLTYGGNFFDAGTGFGPGVHRIQSLTGEIVGSTAGSNTIRLTWTTDLTDPGFDIFRVRFQLTGSWHA
jgi:hypothetical protein